jgi:hypothetical protein
VVVDLVVIAGLVVAAWVVEGDCVTTVVVFGVLAIREGVCASIALPERMKHRKIINDFIIKSFK